MINIKCIETGDVYQLSGDDETFNVTIYSDIAASLAGLMRKGSYLKMHQKDLEYRIALAKLTSFNHAFHAHQRAENLKHTNSMHVLSTPRLMGKSYYQEFARKLNAKRLQNQDALKGFK